MAARAFLTTLQPLLRRHGLRLLGLFCGILLPLITLGTLSAQVRSGVTMPGDVGGLQLVHHYASPQRDALIAFATIAGGWLAVPGLFIVFIGLRWLQRPLGAVFFAVTVTGAWALDVLTKLCFHRARPALWLSPTPRSDYSFPSGHAMIGISIGLALVILAWPTPLRWPALLCGSIGVFLVGLSRLYLGVHFPSDVLAGWCAGLLWTIGVYLVLRPIPVQTRHES